MFDSGPGPSTPHQDHELQNLSKSNETIVTAIRNGPPDQAVPLTSDSHAGPSRRPGPWTPRRDRELRKLQKKTKTNVTVVIDGPADPPALGRWRSRDAAHGPVVETPVETLVERNRAEVRSRLKNGDQDRDGMVSQRSEELLNKNKDLISERLLSP